MLTIILACKPKYEREFEKHLLYLHQLDQSIPTDGWQIDLSSVGYYSDHVYYNSYQERKDTTYYLEFIKYDSLDYQYSVNYKRTYSDQDHYYVVTTDLSDTIFFYFYPKSDSSRKRFVRGKYNYLYKKGKLNYGQRVYYEIHKDSLFGIEGDNLPELPDLVDSLAIDMIPEEVPVKSN